MTAGSQSRMHTSIWCHLAIARTAPGQDKIVHRAHTTFGQDPESMPAQCSSIVVESRFQGRNVRTSKVAATNASVCESRQGEDAAVRDSWFVVRIRQTDDAVEEELHFASPHGEPEFAFTVELNPCASRVNALRYICTYPDLIDAFGADAAAARHHYEASGRLEDREIRFDPLRYVATHQDLHSLWPDIAAICEHYIKHGHAEGRSSFFEPYVYFASNPELIASIEAKPYHMTDQFIRHGFAQGLNCGALDWRAYHERYPDLRTTVAPNEADVARHFVLKGFAEGRRLEPRPN